MTDTFDMRVSDFRKRAFPPIKPSTDLDVASKIILNAGVNLLPVVDDFGKMTGTVSLFDIFDSGALGISPVSSIMRQAHVSVSTTDTILAAVEVLYKANQLSNNMEAITTLPVVDSTTRIVTGILYYRDILLQIRDLIGEVIVGDIMSRDPEVMPLTTPPDKLLYYMMRTSKQQIVIVNRKGNGQLPVGLVRIVDLFDSIPASQHTVDPNLQTSHVMIRLDPLKILQSRQRVKRVIDLFVIPGLDLLIFPVTEKGHLVGTISFLQILKYVLDITVHSRQAL